jgi:hypothetical protein
MLTVWVLWCWPSEFLADRISCGELGPYQVSLSGVKVIMMFLRVFMVESLSQAATGWILALECLLSGTRGSQWLRLVLSNINWPCRSRRPALRSFARYRRLLGVTTGVPIVLSQGKKRAGIGPARGLVLARRTWFPNHFAVGGNCVVSRFVEL